MLFLFSHTADDIFTPEHNEFVNNIPNHIRAIVFAIKSSYKPEMGKNWRSYFTVDMSNGVPGHELKFKDRQLVGSYLRVGLWKNGAWRNFKMRQDFISVSKQKDFLSVPSKYDEMCLTSFHHDRPTKCKWKTTVSAKRLDADL